jgi:hypothetical protein
VQVFQHNTEVYQMGFFKNDVWLETIKCVLVDLARDVHALQPRDASEGALRMKAGELDLEAYWQAAVAVVTAQIAAANAARGEAPTALIASPSAEQVLEFGGDYAEETPDAPSEPAESCAAAP